MTEGLDSCPHCNKPFDTEEESKEAKEFAEEDEEGEPDTEEYACSSCGASISEDAESCPDCGATFVEEEEDDRLSPHEPLPSNQDISPPQYHEMPAELELEGAKRNPLVPLDDSLSDTTRLLFGEPYHLGKHSIFGATIYKRNWLLRVLVFFVTLVVFLGSLFLFLSLVLGSGCRNEMRVGSVSLAALFILSASLFLTYAFYKGLHAVTNHLSGGTISGPAICLVSRKAIWLIPLFPSANRWVIKRGEVGRAVGFGTAGARPRRLLPSIFFRMIMNSVLFGGQTLDELGLLLTVLDDRGQPYKLAIEAWKDTTDGLPIELENAMILLGFQERIF